MNDALSISSQRYALSFTTGALLTREASLLAPVYPALGDWEQVRDRAVEANILQARTVRAGVRLARETVKRLSTLTADELDLLLEATTAERAHLMWVAACRRYALIGEFAEEIVRERYLIRAATLGYADFDSFIRRKALWHEELTTIKESTLQKLRSNVFKMLSEAEVITKGGTILSPMLSSRVAEVLSAGTPSDLRFFPTQIPTEQGAPV